MKVLESVTRYQCEFCKKELKRKHAMVRHEKYCNHNPSTFKACDMCVFITETKIDYMSFNGERTAKSYYCSKLDTVVYPNKVERLGLPEKYPETFSGQMPMPRTCEHRMDEYDYLIPSIDL